MFCKPLWPDFVPFGLSVSIQISLIQIHDSYNDSLYVLHSTFILANCLNWIFRGLHIVPEALYLNITVNAHPGRITPNGKSST